MKNKILIRVYAVSIDEEFEIYIPTNESVKKVLELIVKSVCEFSDNNFDKEVKHCIFNPDNLYIYRNHEIIRDTGLKNGEKLILF